MNTKRFRGFLNGMRYINPRFTYLLTYLLTRLVSITTLLANSHKLQTNAHAELCMLCYHVPDTSGDGVLFSIDFFGYLYLCLYRSLFLC